MITSKLEAVDTNILLYFYDTHDESKRLIAAKLLSRGPTISSQNVSEFVNVLLRK